MPAAFDGDRRNRGTVQFAAGDEGPRSMRVEIVNRQARVRVNCRKIGGLARFLASRPASRPWREQCAETAVLLVDDSGMRSVNQACFGRADDTDVISQRYAAIPGEAGGALGEVIVNVACAARRRPARARRGWDASRELALYVAHGCDHLCGADDATGAARRRMRRRELRWLKQAAALELTRGLIVP